MTLTTETLNLWRNNAEITAGETAEDDPEHIAAKAILALTAEILANREAQPVGKAEITKIAAELVRGDYLSKLWTEAEKSRHVDTHRLQNLLDELQDVMKVKAIAITRLLTAPPAPAVPDGSPRQEAEHVASVLEAIGSFEADDIDGDTVDLRFELDGFDTGSDASITEYAARGADVINQLLRMPADQPVSSGYKLVPVEPTEDMIIDGFESDAFMALADAVNEKNSWPYGCKESAECVEGIFKAMLAAAPEGGNDHDTRR